MEDQGERSLTAEHLRKLERETGSEGGGGGDASGMESLFGDGDVADEVGEEVLVVTESTAEPVSAVTEGSKGTAGNEKGHSEEYKPGRAVTENTYSPPPHRTGAPMVPQMGSNPPSTPSPPTNPTDPSINPNESIRPIIISTESSLPETATEFLHRTSLSKEDETSISPRQKKWLLNDAKISLITERDDAIREYEKAKKDRDQALIDVDGLGKALAKAQQEIWMLKNDGGVSREIEELRGEIGVLEGEVGELRLGRSMAEGRMEDEREEARVYQTTLLDEADALQKEKEALTTQLQEAEEKIKNIQEEKDSLQEVIDSLEAELDAENHSKIRMAHEIVAIKDQIANAPSPDSITSLSQELSSTKATLSKLEEHVTGLQSMLNESSQTIKAQSKTIESLNDAIAAEKVASKLMVEDTAERLADKDRQLAEAIQKRFDTKAKAEGVMNALEGRRVVGVGRAEVLEVERDEARRERDAALERVKVLEGLGSKVGENSNTTGISTSTSVVEEGGKTSFDGMKKRLAMVEEELKSARSELERKPNQISNTYLPPPSSAATPKTEAKATLKAPMTPKKEGEGILSKILKPKPKTRKPAQPKPTKHYWNPDPSARHPSEPTPTSEMISEEKIHAENPSINPFPRWFIWRKTSLNTTSSSIKINSGIAVEGLGNADGSKGKERDLDGVGGGGNQGDGESGGEVFDLEKGWQKEKGKGALGKRKRVEKEVRPRVEGTRVSARVNKGVAPERLGVGESGREKRRKLE